MIFKTYNFNKIQYRSLCEQSFLSISKTVVADAYFSKEPFVKALTTEGFDVVSRFRDDVCLQYVIEPIKTGKQGRPKTNGGAVDLNQMDMKYFNLIE